MSVHVSSWAWSQTISDPTTKLVLLKLADQANDEWECWPSRRTIATDCGIASSSVSRHTAALTSLGLLTIVERQRDNNSQTSNLYRLTPTHERVPPLLAGENPPFSPVTSPEPSSEPSSEPLLAPTSVDAVWDALIDIFGPPPHKNARGKRNAAVKLIKEALNGDFVGDDARAAEIAKRAAMWIQVFPDAAFTDTGFANQWGALQPSRIPDRNDPVRIAEQRAREERLADEASALPPEEQAKRVRELMQNIGRSIT